MKIIFAGMLGVVDVNNSVLMLVPFMLLKLKSKTVKTYIFMGVFFVRGWPPRAENKEFLLFLCLSCQ